jgi:Na+-transporting methylmalonyl-CoA/oxaloacetate decarboxylase gamma subunit
MCKDEDDSANSGVFEESSFILSTLCLFVMFMWLISSIASTCEDCDESVGECESENDKRDEDEDEDGDKDEGEEGNNECGNFTSQVVG